MGQLKRRWLQKRWWVALGIVVVILLLGVGGWQISGEVNRSIGDGKSQLILGVSEGKKMMVVRWRPEAKTWLTLELPEDLYLPMAQGYGAYQVKNWLALDSQERKEGRLLASSLQEGLGIGIDGYMVVPGSKSPRGWLVDIAGGKLRGRPATNLSWWDLWRLWWAWGRIDGGVKSIDLGEVVVLEPVELPGGSQAFKIQEPVLDKAMSGIFLDNELRISPWRVTIVNTTGHSGLGGRVGRIATDMGVVVVNITDSKMALPKSKMIVNKSAQQSVLVKRLQKWLQISLVEVGDTTVQRADVVVWVGEDYWFRVFETD